MLDHAFEDLAQSLRVLLEADVRARMGLLEVDRAEAVGNIENGLTGVLNAFHSLYDACRKEPAYGGPDWYADGPLAVLLAIRNARHHNKAKKIRSIYTYHVQEAGCPTEMHQYVLVDFPALEEGGDTFDVYLSWADLKELLELPRDEGRMRAGSITLIQEYLGAKNYADYAATYGLAESHVFFNVVPIIHNAGLAIMPSIKALLGTSSTEADYFAWHFTNVAGSDMENPEVDAGPFALAG